MKRLLKRKIHDVSTYVMKEFKRPCRECAIVVICTVLLVISSLSTSSSNMELISVDAAGEKNAAPAVYSISEVTEEEHDEVLNESRISPEEAFETSGDFEALGTFEAYDTLKLLQSVQTLTAGTSCNERQDAPAGKAARPDESPSQVPEDGKNGEQPETITVASAETAEKEEVSNEDGSSQNSAFSEDTAVSDMNPETGMPAVENSAVSSGNEGALPETESVQAVQEQSPAEEISVESVEAAAADCEAAKAETNTGGLSASEYDALCRIVEAEAGTEGEEGKLLVANVVLNRVANPAFPATIEGVITADGQFSPVQNGRYQRAVPTPETLAAVNRALNGENISKGALYFKSVHSTANWGNRTLLYNYKNHNFYQ